MTSARQMLVLSGAQMAEPELAANLGLRAGRRKQRQGRLLAALSASPILPELDSLLPGSESGDYFLSRLASFDSKRGKGVFGL